MKNKRSAALAVFYARVIFLFTVLASLFFFALAVTGEGRGLWAIGGCISLLVGVAVLAVAHTLAGKWIAADKTPEREPETPDDQEGIDLDFVLQVREYNAAQLRLILDEQRDLYEPAEIAYLEKLLAEKEASAT